MFHKPLHELSNDRLHRFREKFIDYNFELKWTAGKEHQIADALSRAPVFSGEEDSDLERSRVSVCRKLVADPALAPLFEAATDAEYRARLELGRSPCS